MGAVRRKGELTTESKTGLRDGKGTIVIEHLMEADKGEFYGRGRLFALITVAPGNSVGYHVHEEDMECYYVLEGEGRYDDNGTETTIKEGDTTITLKGEGHALYNDGNKDLVVLALVLFAN